MYYIYSSSGQLFQDTSYLTKPNLTYKMSGKVDDTESYTGQYVETVQQQSTIQTDDFHGFPQSPHANART